MGLTGKAIRMPQHELEEIIQQPQLLEQKIMHKMDNFEGYLNVDKSWDAINFVLTQQIDAIDHNLQPLNKTLFSYEIADERRSDAPHKPAQFLSAQQVAETAEKLKSFTDADFVSRINPTVMFERNIYPDVWDEADIHEYLLDFFRDLKVFCTEAASNGEAVVTFVN